MKKRVIRYKGVSTFFRLVCVVLMLGWDSIITGGDPIHSNRPNWRRVQNYHSRGNQWTIANYLNLSRILFITPTRLIVYRTLISGSCTVHSDSSRSVPTVFLIDVGRRVSCRLFRDGIGGMWPACRRVVLAEDSISNAEPNLRIPFCWSQRQVTNCFDQHLSTPLLVHRKPTSLISHLWTTEINCPLT